MRRLRPVERLAWAGGGMSRPVRGGPAIVAALIAATTLAAFQTASRSGELDGLPGFVADALGKPSGEDPVGGAWTTFENGVSRRTAWGFESIAYGGARPEKYLTVSERQGVRVWRWRLAAGEAGRLTPVARVLDASGRSLEDADVSWSLLPRRGGWLVNLRVADENLPLPYVLEPMTVAQRGIR